MKRRAVSFAERTSAVDDLSGPMGIRFYALRRADSLRLAGPGPSLVVPIETGLVRVQIGAARIVADRTSWVLVPRTAGGVVSTGSPVAKALVLVPTPALVEHTVVTYDGQIDRKAFARLLGAPRTLPRTVWLNELCHRYLFERAVCHKRDNEATRFLETEIVKELYFLCKTDADAAAARDAAKTERPSVLETRSAVVERALRHLDEHLFDDGALADLDRACGASKSTLLRAFKRELGQAPLAYVRARRLDESLLLLKSRRLSISEVATRVGYRNFAAFSQAFRGRFGITPSDARAGVAPTKFAEEGG